MIGLIRETARLTGDVVQGVRDELGRRSLQAYADEYAFKDDLGPGAEGTTLWALSDLRLAFADIGFALSGWAQ